MISLDDTFLLGLSRTGAESSAFAPEDEDFVCGSAQSSLGLRRDRVRLRFCASQDEVVETMDFLSKSFNPHLQINPDAHAWDSR